MNYIICYIIICIDYGICRLRSGSRTEEQNTREQKTAAKMVWTARYTRKVTLKMISRYATMNQPPLNDNVCLHTKLILQRDKSIKDLSCDCCNLKNFKSLNTHSCYNPDVPLRRSYVYRANKILPLLIPMTINECTNVM